ncbi:MAG: glycerophosphodiester phosphodiesterase [Pyrinomonadaceae bacterium]
MSKWPLIIGHRGASAIAPENTLVALSRALSDKADGIEFDVRRARDNVAVVIHDATLQRTGLREGDVATLSSAELKRIDVGTWFNLRNPAKARPEFSRATIPTLTEVFELTRGSACLCYVEMKCEAHENYAALARQVVQLVSDFALAHRVVVESFQLASIKEIKRLDPSIRTAALFERTLKPPVPSVRRIIAQAVACGADELAIHRSFPVHRATRDAARHNLRTVVWTIDAPEWVERATRCGVHALITNDPACLVEARERLRRSSTMNSTL